MWAGFLVVTLLGDPAGAPAVKRIEVLPSARSSIAPRSIRRSGPSRVLAQPPRVPPGLGPCRTVLKPKGPPPGAVGETIRYLVDVDGVSVGTVDFKIERLGTFEGTPVIEYRSLFELDALVSAFVPVQGRAAALVPRTSSWPLKAMNRYHVQENQYDEDITFCRETRQVDLRRTRNGKLKERRRRFTDAVLDFVSGYYAMRAFPAGMSGCAVIVGNGRAYTVWVTPGGRERVDTPVGRRPADRYDIRWASERSKKPLEATLWLGDAPERVPYRAEVKGRHFLEARIHLYQKGPASSDGTGP